MQGFGLLALPASLLLLIASAYAEAHELQWPRRLPRAARYVVQDEEHVKRDLEAQQKLARQTPVGMRKMGDDPGEKFYLRYWQFDKEWQGDATNTEDGQAQRWANHTSLAPAGRVSMVLPAISRHTSSHRLSGRGLFTRDFECPTGYQECNNVGSTVCCQNGELCVRTAGGVGCCPQGSDCGDAVASCDTAAGYQTCPNDGEGGCCLPGSECADHGCVFYGTATVTRTLVTSTVRSTPSTAQPTTVVVTGSGAATTVTITMGRDDTTETVTITEPTTIILGGGAGPGQTPSACSSGLETCPTSLGGGCCQSDPVCAPNSSCEEIATTTAATADAPVRPTSSSQTSHTTITAAGSPDASRTTNGGGCPTGFYMCSAVYLGGCCRVDRDCHTTSCPPTATTDVVTTSGLTIAADATGSCANGWASCAADSGGGCCPFGYRCASNCVNPAGGSDTAKQSPSTASVEGFAWSFVFAGITAATGMLWL